MPKWRSGDWLEAALEILGASLRYSLLTGAGFAAAFGQFLLALLLTAIAIGLFLRLWRAKRLKAARVRQ